MSIIPIERSAIIVNPNASGRRVGREWGTIESGLRRALGAIQILRTERPGHARELARRAVWDGKHTLLSLGGDGTHNEVISGMMQANADPGSLTMGVLNAGTGGDFGRMLTTRGTLEEQAHQLLRADAHPIDVGVLVSDDDLGDRVEQFFLNEASVGISGVICEQLNQSTKRLGAAGYFAYTLKAMATWRPRRVRISVDGQLLGDFAATTTLVANGRYAGGGMRFAPGARLSDQLLDLVIIHGRHPARLIQLTPRMYLGDIRTSRLVTSTTARHVRVEALASPDLPVERDGEPMRAAAIEVSLLPGAVRMLGVRPEVR